MLLLAFGDSVVVLCSSLPLQLAGRPRSAVSCLPHLESHQLTKIISGFHLVHSLSLSTPPSLSPKNEGALLNITFDAVFFLHILPFEKVNTTLVPRSDGLDIFFEAL